MQAIQSVFFNVLKEQHRNWKTFSTSKILISFLQANQSLVGRKSLVVRVNVVKTTEGIQQHTIALVSELSSNLLINRKPTRNSRHFSLKPRDNPRTFEIITDS